MNDISLAPLELLEIKIDDELAQSHDKLIPAEFWQLLISTPIPHLRWQQTNCFVWLGVLIAVNSCSHE